MAHYIALHGLPHRNIYMIFGCRQRGDALYGEEMKALEQKLQGFYDLPTFSRENPDDRTIRRGYVHAVYEEIIQENRVSARQAGDDPAYFYLCGWKNMIDEAKQRILALGYDKRAIHQELYG